MNLLNSVILLIAFLFLVFTFPLGALAVVIVWMLLQLIKKRRRLNEMKGSSKTQQ
jgi:NhaP-type Na+/H+ or K+/H+ antiporter